MPPLLDAPGFGKSAPTNKRIVGVAGLPLVGPAKTVFADCVDKVSVTAPVEAELLCIMPSPVHEVTPPPPPDIVPH